MIDTQAELDAVRKLLQDERRILAEALSATPGPEISEEAHRLRHRFATALAEQLVQRPEALRDLGTLGSLLADQYRAAEEDT